MSGRLQSRTAFITGSSSGIGRAIALRFAAEGANVFCASPSPASRNAANAGIDDVGTNPTHEKIKALYGAGRAAYRQVDVGDEGSIAAAVRECVDTFGRLDIVVTAAGISIESSRAAAVLRAHETPVEDWDRTQNINAKGAFLTCKHAIAQMLKQETLEGTKEKGWVVNLSSVMGKVASHGLVSYASSKGAVEQMTKVMALDYAPDRIHVNCIAAGYVMTGMTAGVFKHLDAQTRAAADALTPLGGMADDPDVIAKAAVFLASDDVEWVTGVSLPVEGGFLLR